MTKYDFNIESFDHYENPPEPPVATKIGAFVTYIKSKDGYVDSSETRRVRQRPIRALGVFGPLTKRAAAEADLPEFRTEVIVYLPALIQPLPKSTEA